MKHATRIAVVLAGLTTMAPSCNLPTVFNRAVLVQRDGAAFELLSISGKDFRAPEAAAFVTLTFANGTTQTIPSMSPQVKLWAVDHIALSIDLPLISPVTKAKVTTKIGGSVVSADVDYYRWDDFDLSMVDPGTSPMVTAADDHGRIWLNTEFHDGLVYWDPGDEQVHQLESYTNPARNIYLFGNTPQHKAIYGESLMYDGHGRMWFTEGGMEPAWFADPSKPNHSRLLAVDTTSLETRVLAVPGNKNGVVGVMWDEARHRVWFSQGARAGNPGWIAPAKLINFDPDVLSYEDSAFDWQPTAACDVAAGVCTNAAHHPCAYAEDCILADRICAPGAPDDGSCYREYPLPAPLDVLLPTELALDQGGSIWFGVNVGGGYIGRLIPETGQKNLFPLAVRSDGGTPAPWDLSIAPNGDVVAHAYLGGRIARLSPAFFEQDCSHLQHPDGVTDCSLPPGAPWSAVRDPGCYNPCIEETPVPNAQFFAVKANEDIVMDKGYLRPNGEFIHFPPLQSTFPSASPADKCQHPEATAALGSVHHVEPDGVVWGAAQFTCRMTRLTPLPPP